MLESVTVVPALPVVGQPLVGFRGDLLQGEDVHVSLQGVELGSGAVGEESVQQEVQQSSTEQSEHSDAQDAACLHIGRERCGVDRGCCGA